MKKLTKIHHLFKNYFLYLFKDKSIRKYLKKEIKSLKPFKIHRWIYSGLERKTFTGFISNKKVFIKVGKNDKSLLHEIKINEKLDQCGYTANVVKIVQAEYDILITEFLTDFKNLHSCNISFKEFENICRAILNILSDLKQRKIIHGDIGWANVYYKNSTIKLIDFDNSYDFSDNFKPKNGGSYNYNSKKWDDAYGFVLLLESLNLHNYFYKCKNFLLLKKQINSFTLGNNF